jgi:hypothetical protein
LDRIGRGAYIRAGGHVDWKGAVFALQQHASLPIWPGGQTALTLQGFAHYLPLNSETVYLYGNPGTRLPVWLDQYDWKVNIRFQAPNLFNTGLSNRKKHIEPLDVSEANFGDFSIQVSSLERAAFELMYGITDGSSFSFSAEIFQGLLNLRPALMQEHLERCRSVKLKRLVMFLANYYRLPWFEGIDSHSISLGKGKRQIVKEGHYDKQFLITVPKEFASGSR